MKPKKIIAETMPLALKMVRQQLGENAIIINTRTIKTGGVFGLFTKQKYEVTAYAVEKENKEFEPKFSKEEIVKPEKRIPDQTKFDHFTKDPEKNSSVFHQTPQKLYKYYSQQPSVADKTLEKSQEKIEEKPLQKQVKNPEVTKEADSALLDELQHMKKMMMNLMMKDSQGNAAPTVMTNWINRLKKQGVDDEVADYIVETLLKKYESIHDLNDAVIKEEIYTIIKDIIEKKVSKTSIVDERTRMINIIGPTGVGKTTSIAKLATEQVLKQKRKVAMITTDVYRIAAVEQLKTYAGILNVPIEVVRSKEELEKALNRLENYDLIYMDSTGRNFKEVQYRDSIKEFLNYPVESDNYLVLSLTTKFEDMQILLNGFLHSPVKKLILTKFDETSSYGSILNIAYKYPYQLSYITNGQSVPEDITTIDAAQMARDILGVEE
ncbi:flagellar biosynthesis protein FlhF [Bacillus sp. BRMEA1]|uniref:flagellar biosynthesis protein FlhF n=1 Tax=Neobacillus endophyticus TaxID=2738405 RepID=UPI001567723D|nr:flagellar biosynthesis protein FlhF [Neobacillus endophyticus]NRD79418.1 flagellar biosynthesis protein FlhF [Neobacillus endophyticus]